MKDKLTLLVALVWQVFCIRLLDVVPCGFADLFCFGCSVPDT